MAKLIMINEDGEKALEQDGIKNESHAKAFVRDFNINNGHKWMGKFKENWIDWNGTLIGTYRKPTYGVYEGDVVIASQPSKAEAMFYMKSGRKLVKW